MTSDLTSAWLSYREAFTPSGNICPQCGWPLTMEDLEAAFRAGAVVETEAGIEDQLYALLVRRGYAQHEAHAIANGPGCTLGCVEKGEPDHDCPAHGYRAQDQDPPAKEPQP